MANLNFKGKTFVQNYHLTVPYHQLVPVKSKSLTKNISLNDNLIIHGDNLKALKALLPTYAGKVKCIYIDPPYNTGNEKWVYNDNVNSPMIKDWLGKIVDKDDLTRHDKWLCMMMPRLKLLRELLSEDGVIFVSIDDNEVYHLRTIMNEVFGEDNFLVEFIWNKKNVVQNDAKFASVNHEYIVSYRKSNLMDKFNLLPRTEDMNARYENPDNDPRGLWTSVALQAKSGSEKNVYEITFPNGVKWKPVVGTYPRMSKESLMKADKEGRLWFGSSGKNVPRLKKYLNEVKQGIVTNSLLFNEDVGSTQSAKELLKIILDDNVFETPKPVNMLKHLILLCSGTNDVILDSFAGSGTTAHAVIDMNKEDNGNRKFILVEMEDYADKITAERVRRVIKGVPTGKDKILKEGLGGSFSYFELGDPIEMESILEGNKLPKYEELARYIFYTATGEEFKFSKVNKKKNFIGETKEYKVYLFYKPDIEYLKSTAFRLDDANNLGAFKDKKRLVFAPTKYLDTEYLLEHRIEFCQLPFEIYRMKK